MESNIIVAGVGGQGSILASHIIAEAAILSKQSGGEQVNVRVGETFGAAQRGGAVASHVRLGSDVQGPLVGHGRADIVLALEPLEGLRVGVPYLAPDGIAILNTVAQQPVDVKVGAVEYPSLESITEALGKIGRGVVTFDASQLAAEAGSAKTLSVVMLGAITATGLLPFHEETIIEAIKNRVPAKLLEVNLNAFALGKQAYQEAKAAAGF